MATYTPPTEILPIFDSSVYVADTTPLTVGEAKKKFVQYPTAQGITTFPSGLKTDTITPIATNGNMTIGSTSTTGETTLKQIVTRQINSLEPTLISKLFNNLGSGGYITIGNNTLSDDQNTIINIYNKTTHYGNVEMTKKLEVSNGIIMNYTESRTATDDIQLFLVDKNGNATTGTLEIGGTNQTSCVINPPTSFTSGIKLNTVSLVNATDTGNLWTTSTTGNIIIGQYQAGDSSYVAINKVPYIYFPINIRTTTKPSVIASTTAIYTQQVGGSITGNVASTAQTINTNKLILTLTSNALSGTNIFNCTFRFTGTGYTLTSPTEWSCWITKTINTSDLGSPASGCVSVPIIGGVTQSAPFNVSLSTYLDDSVTYYVYTRINATAISGLNVSLTWTRNRIA